MSSNNDRMFSIECGIWRSISWYARLLSWILATLARHAAVNARRGWFPRLACWTGGEAGERDEPDAGAGRVRPAAPEPGRRVRSAVHDRCGVLPGRGQGAGQVRDAAGAPGRWCPGHRGRRGAWLLPCGVLSGVGIVRAV